MPDWDGLNDDDENQAGAQPGGGGYEPLDGHVDLTQRQAPFQTTSGLWTPAPLDGSVDLTPAPMTGLLGNFKALPFDGTSERWLYRLPSMGGPGYDDDDGPTPWIISRPIDMTGGTSDGYFRTLGDPSNGPPAGTGAGVSMPSSGATQVEPVTVMGHRNLIDQLGDAVGKIWGLPNTAVGLAAAGAGYVAGKLMGTDPQFHLGNNAIQLTGIPNIIGKNEVGTLGNVQLYEGKAKPTDDGRSYVPGLPGNKLGPHEEAHTRQSQALGMLYFPMWAALGGETPKNPMERAADYYAAGRGGAFSHFDQGPINLFGLKIR
jgi:hypothetical protein